MSENGIDPQTSKENRAAALGYLEEAAELIRAHISGDDYPQWVKMFANLLGAVDSPPITPDLVEPVKVRVEGSPGDVAITAATLTALFRIEA